MRTNIDPIWEKMDQLLETMMEIAQRERTVEMEVRARRIASQVGTSGLVNQDGSFTRIKGGLVHIPVGNVGNMGNVDSHPEVSSAYA